MTHERTALVVGGLRGIGEAISARLGDAGYRVVATSRDPDQRRTNDLDMKQVTALRLDLTSHDSVRECRRELVSRGVSPQVLVLNAGVSEGQLFPLCDFEKWVDVLTTNLIGSAFVVRTFAADMITMGWGRIIFVSSISGIRGTVGQSAYAASKAGLVGFAKSLARELGRFGINVNCVSPGTIETSMLEAMPEQLLADRTQNSALRRLGKPDDVARLVSVLCGEAGDYITGQNVVVDGGIVMQ